MFDRIRQMSESTIASTKTGEALGSVNPEENLDSSVLALKDKLVFSSPEDELI